MERLKKVPTSLSGIWGEFAVVLALREAGWNVDWDGGMTSGRDVRAERNSLSLHIQVKTSTVRDGRISWRKTGEAARIWGEKVKREGAVAVYAFVHFRSAPVALLDRERRALRVEMPREYEVTAATASEFATDVDDERERYAKRTRLVGPRKGELLPVDGLAFPVCAPNYPSITRFFV